jgi:hypothetical protein
VRDCLLRDGNLENCFGFPSQLKVYAEELSIKRMSEVKMAAMIPFHKKHEMRMYMQE